MTLSNAPRRLSQHQWVSLQQNALAMMKLYGSENVLAAVEETLRYDWGLSESQKHDLDIACAFLELAQRQIAKVNLLPGTVRAGDSQL